MLDANKYTGRAGKQVEEYLKEIVKPIIERYESSSKGVSELSLWENNYFIHILLVW